MQVKIYGGNKIGGCITEVVSYNGTRILIDAGSNLPSPDNKRKPEVPIKQLCEGKDGEKRVSAVLVTHYHGDHVGLFEEVPDDIPVYMGKAAKKIYRVLGGCTHKNTKKIDRIKTFEMGIPVKVKDFIFIPYRVDHSAYDAYMYLISADGKTFIHTGDFRTHGYTGSGVMKVARKLIRETNCIITEGTMLARRDETQLRESELYDIAFTWLKEHDLFVLCSSTNIDSIVSFYRAARDNGKIFVVDNYQKEVLDIITKDLNKKKNTEIYSFDDEHIELFSRTINRTLYPKMLKYGFCALVRVNPSPKQDVLDTKFARLVSKDCFSKSKLFYSMWKGYLDGEHKNPDICKFLSLKPGFISEHTSGHASFADIEELIQILNPDKIIPIHTEKPEALYDMNIDTSKIVLNTGDFIEI